MSTLSNLPEKQTAIDIVNPFSFKLIYVFSINDDAHKGMLKIGETTIKGFSPEVLTPNCDALNAAARERINEYTKTAGIYYNLLHTELAFGKKHFGDKAVHRVLQNSGIKRTPPPGSKGTEWFTVDLETVKAAITAVKEGRPSLTPGEISHEQEPIVLRLEQQQAVDHTLMRFKQVDSVLWHAKMRFGKTITTLALIKEAKYKRTIVFTHRPAVIDGWFEDFKLVFAGEKDIFFLTKDSWNLAQALKDDKKRVVYFASTQDLRGSTEVGGKFDKNEEIFGVDWDLVVIDEAHEGTQTVLGQNVSSALTKKKSKTLYLSGTPFNIQDEFKPEDVYTWDYIAEQTAKRNWAIEHEGDSNPYAGLPEMRMFTYALGAVFKNYEEHSIEGKCFNFREFLRTWTGDEEIDEGKMPVGAQIGDLVHEKDVRKFLELLRAKGYDNNYPFTTEAYREALRHTLWKVPGVKEAKALERLLEQDEVFGKFTIVNVAGEGNGEEDESDDALQRVRNAIDENPYTITLSCGRLTTGVTVKEWTGVLMLAGGDKVAAANYLQTIFRVQSPYTDEQGRVKDLCYAFDFAPDRVLSICPKMVQNKEHPLTGGGTGGEAPSEKKRLGTLLNFFPIISVKGSELHSFEVSDIYQVIKRYTATKAIRSGFSDSSIYNHQALKIENINAADFNNLHGIIGKTAGLKPTTEIDLSKTGMTGEERKKAQAATRKPKRQLTPEEKELLERLKEEKRQRQNAIDILRGISIRMPLLIYGAKVDYTEDITIQRFVQIVDDESWEEFMPKGVTKELFGKFIQYYDEGVFTVASREIRELARNADGYSPTERVKEIVKIFSYFRNPDKETVLTPWRVVNMHMSDTIGGWNFFTEDYKAMLESPRHVEQGSVTKQLFSNDAARILELNSKSGLYPLYLAYSIFRERCEKLKVQKVELTRETQQVVWRDVVKENIFVVCKTPMAKTITRRTLLGYYPEEAGDCNLEYFHNLIPVLRNNPERFVRNVLNPSTWNKKGLSTMKFDAVVGNPPYQAFLGGKSPLPIYHYFIEAAIKLSPNYVSMISPSRWFNTGTGLDDFRKERMKDKHIRVMHDFAEANLCFQNVDIKGGINYFLWDKSYEGDVSFTTHCVDKPIKTSIRPLFLEGIDVFIRNEELIPIYQKVQAKAERTFDEILSSRDPFGFDIRLEGSMKIAPHQYSLKKVNETDVKFYSVNWRKEGVGYVPRERVKENVDWIDKYKVLIPKAWGTGIPGKDRLNGFIVEPGSVCTETYIVMGPFETKAEAENALAYTKTIFFLAMVSMRKTTQNAAKGVYRSIPLQDFSKPWTDEELYKKYELTEEDIAFIESMIRPME